jgi:hypothetical protein
MSQSNSSAGVGGIGFLGALFLLFLGLKLGEVGVVATWSWWWVCSPLLVGPAFLVIILTLALLCAGIVGLAKLVTRN